MRETGVQAVIFDLDGVLIDSEVFYMQRLKGFAWKEFGADVPAEDLLRIVGASGPAHWETIRPYLPPSFSYEDFRLRYHRFGERNPVNYRELMFGDVAGLMRGLREEGYRLALATSSPQEKVAQVIQDCGLSSYLEEIVTRDQVSRAKPDPEIYRICLARLGLDAGHCLVVEDSPIGIRAGKAAGITVAARRETRYPLDQSEADYMLEQLSELPDLLQHLQEKG